MAKRKSELLTLLALTGLLASSAHGAPRSPFNGRSLDCPGPGKPYSFLVAGHAYGAHSRSVYPSSSLLANIDRLNEGRPLFLALLGDIVRQAQPGHFDLFRKSFASKLRFPVYNAPGNHDMGDRRLYLQRFSPIPFAFRCGAGAFLFLDSESDDGDMKGPQLRFVREELEHAREEPGIRRVFVFSHRLLWAMGNPPLDRIIPHVNGPDIHTGKGLGFLREVLPLLRALKDKEVFLFAGDVGTAWSLPLFYHKEPGTPVTYVATGLGDTEKDLLVRVDLSADAKVSLTPVSLTGFLPPAQEDGRTGMERFGLGAWLRHFAAHPVRRQR